MTYIRDLTVVVKYTNTKTQQRTNCGHDCWDVLYVASGSWWRHQMKTFSVLLALCVGNSPVTGEFPTQRPVTRSFDVFFDLRLNKRLSKQWWGWWLETLSRPLWRHHNVGDLTWSHCTLARARPAVPLGLWSITSSLRGNLYVHRLHKFIKWFANNDVAHRN